MTAPTIRSSTTAVALSSAATTTSVTLPATVSAGDVLVILIASSNSTALSITGWTQAFWDTTQTYPTGILYKVAAGTEGGTSVTMNVVNGANYGYVTASIQGTDPAGMSWAAAAGATGASRTTISIASAKMPTEYFDLTFMAADVIASGITAAGVFTLVTQIATGPICSALLSSSYTESEALRGNATCATASGTAASATTLRVSFAATTQNTTAGYPYIRMMKYLADTAGTTSRTLTLPAVANAGELLVVVSCKDAGMTVPTTPAGYTVGATSATDGYAYYYKVAAGGETSVVIASTSQQFDNTFLCIPNYVTHQYAATTATANGATVAVAGGVPISTTKLLSVVFYWYKSGGGGISISSVSSGYIGATASTWANSDDANARLFNFQILYNSSATGSQSPGTLATTSTNVVASLNIGIGADNTGGANLFFGSNF